MVTKEKIEQAFVLRDGVLWRKSYTDSRYRLYPEKRIESKPNNSKGYCVVSLQGKSVYYHTIIWVLHNGNIPNGFVVDHIDGNCHNNNINNLRIVSNRKNLQNTRRHREGGLVGASFHKPTGKWQAQIRVGRKKKHLGYYDTEQEAHQAYLKEESQL
jgi:hypothetical protein